MKETVLHIPEQSFKSLGNRRALMSRHAVM